MKLSKFMAAIMIAAAFTVASCAPNFSASGGTAFNEMSTYDVGTPEFQEFCRQRDDKGLLVSTVGFVVDLILPQGIQSIAAIFRGRGDQLLDNPTTTALNRKCHKQNLLAPPADVEAEQDVEQKPAPVQNLNTDDKTVSDHTSPKHIWDKTTPLPAIKAVSMFYADLHMRSHGFADYAPAYRHLRQHRPGRESAK